MVKPSSCIGLMFKTALLAMFKLKEKRSSMDRYSEIMLHDDMSSREELTISCPNCQVEIVVKLSDQFAKCMKCGEQFYLEEYDD